MTFSIGNNSTSYNAYSNGTTVPAQKAEKTVPLGSNQPNCGHEHSIEDKTLEKLEQILQEIFAGEDIDIHADAKILKNLANRFHIDLAKTTKEITPEQITKIKESLKPIIKDLKDSGVEITLTTLYEAQVAHSNGLKYSEMPHKALREALGVDENTEIKPEMIKQYMTDMSKRIQDQIKSLPKEEQADEFLRIQKLEIDSLFLGTTNKADKKLLAYIFQNKNITAETTEHFLNDVLDGLDPEVRQEIALQIRNRKDAFRNGNGNVVDKNTGMIIYTLASKELETGALVEYNKADAIEYKEHETEIADFRAKHSDISVEEFLNSDKVKAVLAKSPEELTNEDKALLKEIEIANLIVTHPVKAASALTVTTDRGDIKAAQEINYDNQQLSDYNEVITTVKDYIEEHPECLSMNAEDFAKEMDKVTNGNYSIISENPNAAPSELNAPKDPNATSTADTIGYKNDGCAPDNSGVDQAWAPILAQSPVDNKEEFEIVKSSPARVTADNDTQEWTSKDIAKDPIGYLKYCRGKITNPKDKIDLTLAFDRVSKVIQIELLGRTCGTLFNLFFNAASDNVVLNTRTGRTYAQTKQLQEKQDEIKEKQKA